MENGLEITTKQLKVLEETEDRLRAEISSICIWKYRTNNTIEKRDEHDRALEYIWTRDKVIDVSELKIGEREFELKVLPNKVNVLEGARRALYIFGELGEKKHVNSFKNVNQIKYLVEYYYADNAKEYNNHGWMFTVSKVIPLLYDCHLAYTPSLHINPYDQKKGNNANVILYSFAVKPRLEPKKVINDNKQMSPFLRVIHEEKDYEFDRTPTIMTVLNLNEIVQIIREGPRYMNIFNMFDLLSVSNNIAGFLCDYVFALPKSVYNSVLAFTILYIDKSSRLDNYYSNPLSSIEAIFFWINGRWDLGAFVKTNKAGLRVQ
ncbi:4379_t:CDS:10 [Diversispora eburnea]|uniref:4379_t:CDS:1 n=1 Tax=Diversispora eburnea TaxID=1213867 RepID=A0A9N8YPX2_9GLOM|nr:4379_t:CDS:10 [Diversispora eburnea]